MFELTILVLSAITNLLLGLVVFLKNSRSVTNRYFLVLTGSFVAWSVVNYISVHPFLFDQLWWIRLVLFCAAFLCLSVYLTFSVFPEYKMPSGKKHTSLIVILTIAVMTLTLTPLVFEKLDINDGNVQPVPGPGIVLFFLLVVGLLGSGLVRLILKYRKSVGLQRLQIRFVLFGLAGTFSLIVLTNFLLVIVFNNSKLVPLGPAYTLIFSSALAYAIIRHRLFDIRAAAARTLAYILSLGSIGLFYGSFVFLTTSLLANGSTISTTQRVIYIGFALITALLFPRIKTFFDRITNKLFFKDHYDPHLFIDQLNGILVRTIKLEDLLERSSKLVAHTIKANYVEFVLFDRKNSTRLRTFSGFKPSFSELMPDIVRTINKNHTKLIVSDELSGMHHSDLRDQLSQIDTAAIVRLTTHQHQIGYLFVGLKQSGDAYSVNDLRILDIIADEMSLAIQNALRFEEIQRFNVTLQEKVSEATRELRKTNAKLKALDQAKDEFISMASHQLRTPLTAVKGYLSMILDGDTGPVKKDQKELVQSAFDGSQRMVYLIADLLNVSRMQTGKFVITNQPSYLPDVIEGEIAQLKEQITNRQIELTYEKPSKFPTLNLDETKVRQVIMNFLDNALYYTPKGGKVEVKLEATDNDVSYTVTDTGVGVPKEIQHHLFSKFYRADNARKMRPDGTGLGLYMAKKVIIAQGGAIIFKSEEGKGSTFGFSFPRKALEVKS
jgi:signal transduction histidine kinase